MHLAATLALLLDVPRRTRGVGREAPVDELLKRLFGFTESEPGSEPPEPRATSKPRVSKQHARSTSGAAMVQRRVSVSVFMARGYLSWLICRQPKQEPTHEHRLSPAGTADAEAGSGPLAGPNINTCCLA